jgi:hypothetical protein
MMDNLVNNPQRALKYKSQVTSEGKIELNVPLIPGAQVTIFVFEEAESFNDLLFASETSLDFWDNPLDDEDWNHV